MTQKSLLFAAAIFICALGGWQWVRVSGAKVPAPQAATPLTVTVAPARQRDLPITLAATGRTEPKASVAVKSRLDGQVAEIAFTEGHAVRKGQLLVRMDSSLIEAQARQAEGVLARDEAQLAKLQGDYQRNLALVGQGFISQSGLSQSKADMQAAQGSVKTDRAALESARLQLGYTRITAPVDGVAGALLVPVGGAAKANDTTLLLVNQVQPMYVTFSLPESQLPAVKAALHNGTVPVFATVAGIDHPVAGQLAFLDNTVDPASGAITAKGIFPNTDGALTAGVFAQVSVQIDSVANALVVPAQAVESGVDGPYAFVVNADSTVSLRRLTLGPRSGSEQVVLAGVRSGEQLVTSGQERLRDKGRVTVEGTQPAVRSTP